MPLTPHKSTFVHSLMLSNPAHIGRAVWSRRDVAGQSAHHLHVGCSIRQAAWTACNGPILHPIVVSMRCEHFVRILQAARVYTLFGHARKPFAQFSTRNGEDHVWFGMFGLGAPECFGFGSHGTPRPPLIDAARQGWQRLGVVYEVVWSRADQPLVLLLLSLFVRQGVLEACVDLNELDARLHYV